MKKINLDGATLDEIREYKKNFEKKCDKKMLISVLATSSSLFINTELFFIVTAITIGLEVDIMIKLYKLFLDNTTFYINSKEFQDVYKLYNLFLNDLLKLFKSLGYDNEAKIFAGYSYMLKYGFLSSGHKFFTTKDSIDCQYLLGSDIINGFGCCRNINVALTDLLREANYDAHDIQLRVDSLKYFLNNINFLNEELIFELQELDNKLNGGILNPVNEDELNKYLSSYPLKIEDVIEFLNIKQTPSTETKDNKLNIQSFIKQFLENNKKIPNHIATLYSGENHSYIMDAQNDVILKVDSDRHIYQDNNYFFAKNKLPFASLNIKYKLNEKLKPTGDELLEKVISDYQSVFTYCPELSDVFETFYKEHAELYQDIISRKRILVNNLNKK